MPEPVDVALGWRACSPQAALAQIPPDPLGPEGGALAGRVIVVRASFDLRLRLVRRGQGAARFERVEEPGALSPTAVAALVSPIVPTAQRSDAVPAVQIALNLMLVTDAPAVLQLMPPFLSPAFRDWPGTLVCGRFPLTAWPRPLNAVLEWSDPDRDWVLRRGDPLVYLMPEFDDPAKRPALVEAELTPALRRHFAMVDNVSSFGRNVGPMFDQAAARRPARLLEPKQTGAPRWD